MPRASQETHFEKRVCLPLAESVSSCPFSIVPAPVTVAGSSHANDADALSSRIFEAGRAQNNKIKDAKRKKLDAMTLLAIRAQQQFQGLVSRSRALTQPPPCDSFLSWSAHCCYPNFIQQIQTAGGRMRSGRTPASGVSGQVAIDSREGLDFKRAPVRRRDVSESGSRVLRLPAGWLASFSPFLGFAWISVVFPSV